MTAPAGQTRIPARLYLATPPIAEARPFCEVLPELLSAGDIAAVLLRLAPADERKLINVIKEIAAVVQAQDRALIVEGRADLVARSNADGAHLHGLDAFQSERDTLKPERIVGVSGLVTRHDAMIAAEQGADYIMFGAPDENGAPPNFESVLDRIRWWSELFQVPCVGFARTADQVEALTAAGADFVALGDFVFAEPQHSLACVRAAAAAANMEVVS